MKPEIGKCYKIKYLKKSSKNAFHGPALCVKKARKQDYAGDCWLFVDLTAIQYDYSDFNLIAFKSTDIVEECESPPTYWELLEFIQGYKNKKALKLIERTKNLNWCKEKQQEALGKLK